ncbi:MAG: hypothetical protein GF320_09865 [Armatimonadia bacterium]|nr:hypothetical protein [Armatimonadia bacterium]
MTITQLSVFLGEDSGSLSKMSDTLAGAGINVRALSVVADPTHRIARIVVDDTDRARSILGEVGFMVNAADVIVVRAPHKTGTLAVITRALWDAEVPVEYMYGTSAPGARDIAVVIRTSEAQVCLTALDQAGLEAMGAADLAG